MSFFENANYNVSNRNMFPEWIRSERYDYCEGFYESVHGSKSERLMDKIISILKTTY